MSASRSYLRPVRDRKNLDVTISTSNGVRNILAKMDDAGFGARVVRTARLTIPHPELPRRDWWQRELAELDAATAALFAAAPAGAAA